MNSLNLLFAWQRAKANKRRTDVVFEVRGLSITMAESTDLGVKQVNRFIEADELVRYDAGGVDGLIATVVRSLAMDLQLLTEKAKQPKAKPKKSLE